VIVAAAASPSVPVVIGTRATAVAVDDDVAAAESRETVCEGSWRGLPETNVVGLGAIGFPTVVITGCTGWIACTGCMGWTGCAA